MRWFLASSAIAEMIDGVRCMWDGVHLLTIYGQPIHGVGVERFISKLPPLMMAGVLRCVSVCLICLSGQDSERTRSFVLRNGLPSTVHAFRSDR